MSDLKRVIFTISYSYNHSSVQKKKCLESEGPEKPLYEPKVFPPGSGTDLGDFPSPAAVLPQSLKNLLKRILQPARTDFQGGCRLQQEGQGTRKIMLCSALKA